MSQYIIEKFSDTDIKEFFKRHLLYRLKMLKGQRIVEKNLNMKNIDSLLKETIEISTHEASKIAGRMFLEFLGVGVEKGKLCVNKKPKQYDVRVENLGGVPIDIADLTSDEQDLLVTFCLTVHKSSAHFTHNEPFGIDWEIVAPGIDLIERLLKRNLYDIVNEPFPEM